MGGSEPHSRVPSSSTGGPVHQVRDASPEKLHPEAAGGRGPRSEEADAEVSRARGAAGFARPGEHSLCPPPGRDTHVMQQVSWVFQEGGSASWVGIWDLSWAFLILCPCLLLIKISFSPPFYERNFKRKHWLKICSLGSEMGEVTFPGGHLRDNVSTLFLTLMSGKFHVG